MLEITCQASEVKVLPVDDLRVIRAYDFLSGVIVNIPVTAAALAVLITDATALAA